MNKANSIINKFLLAGDKFMPEFHLVDPTVKKYGECGSFRKNTQRIKDFLNSGKLSYIYKNDLDKACFQHDMAYNKFKDLETRTQSDIVLKNKALKIASNPKYNGYERGLASMVRKFFDKESKGRGLKENQGDFLQNSGNLIANSQLADELHKPIIRKFKKRKVYSSLLKDSDISMYSTYNEGKSVVAERFIRTLKNKIYKHMISISKNVYFDVLDDIVDKYNNTYHKTIKMKPIDVKNDSFAEYNEKSNKKDPKFKVGDHVRISKTYLLKDIHLIGVKKFLLLKK